MNSTIWILSASFLGAFAPMVLYTSIVWWMDRYEREPIRLVAMLFLFGAVPGALLSLGAHWLVTAIAPHFLVTVSGELISIALIAPLLERLCHN